MSFLLMIFGWLRKVPFWLWLALAAAGVIGWQHVEISHYRSKVATVEAQSAAYVAAQKTQLATIATLQLANRQWAAKYDADMAMGKFYTDAAVKYALAQQKQKFAAQRSLKVIYEHDPSARQWSERQPPAAVADRLRANAGGSH